MLAIIWQSSLYSNETVLLIQDMLIRLTKWACAIEGSLAFLTENRREMYLQVL